MRLLTPEGVYCEYAYQSEAEMESYINRYASAIFGQNCFFLDIKQRLRSLTRMRGTIIDGMLLDLKNPNQSNLYLVEVERLSHGPDHIIRQLIRFARTARDNQHELLQALNNGVRENRVITEAVTAYATQTDTDLSGILYQAVYLNPIRILVIIDDTDKYLEDWANEDAALRQIMRFKIYVKLDSSSEDHIIVFDDIFAETSSQISISPPSLLERSASINVPSEIMPAIQEIQRASIKQKCKNTAELILKMYEGHTFPEAVNIVAENHHILYQSVSDACTRQLRFRGVNEFLDAVTSGTIIERLNEFCL